MGMFDTLHSEDGNDWQTKAVECELSHYRIGEPAPIPTGSYQMRVLGKQGWAWATIRDGVLVKVPDERDPDLWAMAYYGGPWIEGLEK